MRSVQSELISKNFTGMCFLMDSSCEESKHSKINVTPETVATSSSLNFGDGNCGRFRPPLHLQLDFTPNDEEDNDFSQNKCCAFWDFIKNTPEIESTKVDTELTKIMKESCHPKEVFTTTASNKTESGVRLQTAVSMLSFIQKKGYIDGMFKLDATKRCSVEDQDYSHEREAKKKVKTTYDFTCRSDSRSDQKADVVSLNSEMEKFDKDHPKSMEPPGHYPELKHCILQRKVDNKSYLQ